MAVLPGSLDYLYYNGILDRIPYEAYEMGPMTQSGLAQASGLGTGYGLNYTAQGYGSLNSMNQMNATKYLKNAQKGLLYNTYNHPDTFVHRDDSAYSTKSSSRSFLDRAYSDGEGYSRDVDYEVMANGQEGKNFREAIMEAASKTKETVSNSPNWVKGLLAGGLIITTACCLLRGKKTPVQNVQKTSLLHKLNPVNWFK